MHNEAESILIQFSTPLYALFIGLELVLSNWQHRQVYTIKDTFSNVYLTTLNLIVDFFCRGFGFVMLTFFYSHFRVVSFEWSIGYWLVLFLAEDIIFYCLHRVDHSVRLFWAVHVTHHNSEHFNFTTGFRSSVFQPIYRFFFFIPLALLGFHALDIFLMYSITQIYGILVHTQLVGKLGWLEYILVTPSHHRVHHAANVRYLDRNLGMVLIIWDKLFGTFTPEVEEDPVHYGLYQKRIPIHPFHLVFHEWVSIWTDIKRAPTWSSKFGYVLKPPGWSHDGQTKTADQLRAEQGYSLDDVRGNSK
jgi:sterol desaturase/sphingolipid hydroxylase (fatty acid hydroxylase superfamily)